MSNQTVRTAYRLALIGAGCLLSAPILAGVKALSSSEMVETYVEDSAVIIVPKDQQQIEKNRERVLRALTISPGEPVLSEAEEEAYREALAKLQREGKGDALGNAEEEFLRRALLLPVDELAQLQAPRDFTPQVSPIIFGQQAQIPDEPFTQNFLNNQLGINYDGQNLNFGIGAPPGINNIQVPRSINEGPINLIPRPGGGFDLSIAVPDR